MFYFFIFGHAGFLLLRGLFSAYGEWRLLSMSRHLIAVASFVAEHRLWGTQTSVVAAHGLSS